MHLNQCQSVTLTLVILNSKPQFSFIKLKNESMCQLSSTNLCKIITTLACLAFVYFYWWNGLLPLIITFIDKTSTGRCFRSLNSPLLMLSHCSSPSSTGHIPKAFIQHFRTQSSFQENAGFRYIFRKAV